LKASNNQVSQPEDDGDIRGEIERIARVSNMLVTGHSNLRERYAKRALALDVTILGVSVWLTSVVFVEPKIGLTLTPFHMDPQIWIGLLSIATLFLSVIQLRVDWKGQSDAHKRSADIYSKVKSETRHLLEAKRAITREDARELLIQYELSSDLGCSIPENEFLKQKTEHLKKVAISKFLDKHPGASITLLRLRLWWHSNITKRGAPIV
jgi:hypothetical protein